MFGFSRQLCKFIPSILKLDYCGGRVCVITAVQLVAVIQLYACTNYSFSLNSSKILHGKAVLFHHGNWEEHIDKIKT